MLCSMAVRRGIDMNSPFIIDEWLLLLTDRQVPFGGAENPAPTSWKPGLQSRVEQTLDTLKITRAAMAGEEIEFEDLVSAATKAEEGIDKDLAKAFRGPKPSFMRRQGQQYLQRQREVGARWWPQCRMALRP